MLSEDLKRLQGHVPVQEKATEGPWEHLDGPMEYTCDECGAEFPEQGYRVCSKDKYQVLECHLYGMERFAKPNCEFIATSRTEWEWATQKALKWGKALQLIDEWVQHCCKEMPSCLKCEIEGILSDNVKSGGP